MANTYLTRTKAQQEMDKSLLYLLGLKGLVQIGNK